MSLKTWKAKCERHFIACDSIIGILLSLALYCYLSATGQVQQYCSNKREIALLIINISIPLFGFVLAGVTILATCMPQKLKERLNQEEDLFSDQIFNVFFYALNVLMLIIVISVVTIFINHFLPFLLLILLILAAVLIFLIIRSVWILKHLTKLTLKDNPK